MLGKNGGDFLRSFLVVFWVVGCLATVADAKTKRMDNDLVKTAEAMAKDREAAFAGEEAKPVSEFQEDWTALAKALDDEYAEHTVKLKTFGNDVKTRKVFSHLLYMALRVGQKAHLEPSPGELISRHTFLQDLTINGACYTGGDTFPKKLKDLLKPRFEIQTVIRGHLDSWDEKYRKKFEKEFGKAE